MSSGRSARLFAVAWRLVTALALAVAACGGTVSVAQADSVIGGGISRAEVIARVQDWYHRSPALAYDESRTPGSLVSDLDGTAKYGPDCSGMVSMAWHLRPGSAGGLNTNSLPSVATQISTDDLQPGDLLDDVADGHAIVFDSWRPDHVHFSYYSFGASPMLYYDGGSGRTEGPLGSFSSGAELAGWPASHYAAYRYDNIVDARVGVLGADGSVLVKDGGLSAGWHTEYPGAKQVVLSGDRIGVLTTDGTALVKEGGVSAGWHTEHTGVTQLALSGDRIGVLTTDGTALVKEGGVSAGWHTEYHGVKELTLDSDRVGVLTADGKALVKEGSLGAGWHTEYSGVKQLGLAGDRVGVLTDGGKALVKEGSLSAGWHTEYSGVKQLALTARRIGVLTTGGVALVKEGGLSSGWHSEYTGVSALTLGGYRIGVLSTGGKALVKEGELSATWHTEYTGVKQIALS